MASTEQLKQVFSHKYIEQEDGTWKKVLHTPNGK